MKPLYHPYFVNFIVYFNENQDFFECHEVLEDYWNEFPSRTKDHPLTAYILLATGLYHWRRGNERGALRTLRKALAKLRMIPEQNSLFAKGIDFSVLCNHVQNSVQSIEVHQPFTSFSIDMTSAKLRALVEMEKPRMQLLPFGSDAIIHKHKLRDRSDVIRLRDEKKKGRH